MLQNIYSYFAVKSFYSDVTWALKCSKSLATWLFVQESVLANDKENIKVSHYWPSERATHCQYTQYISGLVQDCSNSIADALGLLQSCTKPWWLADSTHKGLIMGKALPCQEAIRCHNVLLSFPGFHISRQVLPTAKMWRKLWSVCWTASCCEWRNLSTKHTQMCVMAENWGQNTN